MYIKVKVTAGAKKDKIDKKRDDYYLVSVKEKAERNMANNKVRELMARLLGISTPSIRIISGHHSTSKILSIKDF